MNIRSAKNELFQLLKPCCVKLSQLALRADESSAGQKALLDTTNELYEVLHQKCRNNVFDEKLADYVFFPLSHVFKICQKRPGRLAEIATACLQILLQYGWKNALAIELARQFLILLTLFAGSGQPQFQVSEELKREAFHALALLFENLRRAPRGPDSLTEATTIPALGQCLATILGGVTNGESSDVQLEALCALEALWLAIKDQQALSTFLPGTVSALTKSLMPDTKTPRSGKVLISGLKALSKVLSATIGDIRVTNLPDDCDDKAAETKTPTSLTKSWLKATSAQIKLALANIVKLRNHRNLDVREELGQTCLVLLDECHSSLQDSASLLVETAMAVASDSPSESSISSGQMNLKDLASIHPSINELVQTTTYTWATSLPRIMQSSDEVTKASALKRLSHAHCFLGDYLISSEVLDDALLTNMRDAVMNTLEAPKSAHAVQLISLTNGESTPLTIANESFRANSFPPIILPHQSQNATRDQLTRLVNNIGNAEVQLDMASKTLEQMSNSTDIGLLSALWVSLQLLKSASSKSQELESFFTLPTEPSAAEQSVMEEIYNFAVSTISETEDEEKDWRLIAIGLEVIAYSSHRMKEEFRHNLVDSLYPVVQLLGSDNQKLREHAIIALNIISDSCGYRDASDLVVQNVDYLVNAVSLKLNTFNISPQAPRMLIMMIRLTGPTLLPYLDDIVSSIFAALDNFHGYPQLVDSLFSVLAEVVEESTKSGQLQLASTTQSTHKKRTSSAVTIDDVANIIRRIKSKESVREQLADEAFPQEPWKSAKTLLDEIGEQSNQTTSEEPQESVDIVRPAPTKVYKMVESVARLSQHYLTSSSPHLRLRLLNLLNTASSALQSNEDAFLPLVNDIWPVVLKRLYDQEPFVVIGAANTIAKICEAAGDFMATRIETEWHDLLVLVRQWKTRAEADKKKKHNRGVHSFDSQVWESMISLMVAILEYVRIDDTMFDDVCEILSTVIERENVRKALETINADAVYLLDILEGRIRERNTPQMDNFQFAKIEVL